MILIDKEITVGDYNTAKVVNTFFSHIASNLNIAEHSNWIHFANNINDPVLKCNVKYRSHYSILAIQEVCNKNPRFQFSFLKINKELLMDILILETSKACQDTDIST